jgi:hypothetical protein
MRLLNIETIKLEFFESSRSAPRYAILSHVWGRDEVLYNDIQEKHYHQAHQNLLNRLEDLQLRFDNLQSRLENVESRDNKSTRQLPLLDQRGRLEHQPRGSPNSDGKQKVKNESADTRLRFARSKEAWSKVEGCCREAAKLGFDYIWIDNFCSIIPLAVDTFSTSVRSTAGNFQEIWTDKA